jgi:hypothetical protein
MGAIQQKHMHQDGVWVVNCGKLHLQNLFMAVTTFSCLELERVPPKEESVIQHNGSAERQVQLTIDIMGWGHLNKGCNNNTRYCE